MRVHNPIVRSESLNPKTKTIQKTDPTPSSCIMEAAAARERLRSFATSSNSAQTLTCQLPTATRRPADGRQRPFIFSCLFFNARLPVLDVGIHLVLRVHMRKKLDVVRFDLLALDLEGWELSTRGLAALALGGIQRAR